VHDLSSQCSKESSLIQISESCHHTKNDGGTDEGKKHRAHGVFVVLKKGSKPCAQKAKFSVTVVNTYLVPAYNMALSSHLFEAFNAKSSIILTGRNGFLQLQKADICLLPHARQGFALRAGFEPSANRLTTERSATELP
jgi:hypothetical protein